MSIDRYIPAVRIVHARGCGKPFLNLAYILKLFGYSQKEVMNFIFKEEETK